MTGLPDAASTAACRQDARERGQVPDRQAYGLTIRTEIDLPELVLAPAGDAQPPAVSIRFGAVAADGIGDGRRLGPFLWVTPQDIWLHVPGVARYLVRDGREIVIDPEPDADDDSIRVFLLGSALGALLFQRGFLVLHGNAVRVGDQCMVCVGRSGAGKSTLAAGFLRRGYQVLADDVVPVDGECRALPGFPRIKLWRDVADHLNIDVAPLRRIRPAMEKFNVPLDHSAVQAPLPVRWVYILDSHNRDDTVFETIRGLDRFVPLYRNTYRVRFLEGMALKPAHLGLCGKLAGRIRLARITRPQHGFGLERLVDHILSDIAANP